MPQAHLPAMTSSFLASSLSPRIAARVLARYVLVCLGGRGSGNFGHAGRPRSVSIDEKRTKSLRAGLKTLGGPGSGHFDHVGRPGEVGGSLPSGGSGVEIELPDPEELARDKADTSGVNYTGAGRSVVSFYAEGGFMQNINPLLRSRKKEQPVDQLSWNFVHKMDVEMAPSEESTTLYRVLNSRRASGLQQGDEFVDYGFMSTSKSEDALSTIVEDVGLPDNYSQIVIHAPKGTKQIDVNKKLKDHDYEHQHEVVLARGTKFRVTSVTGKKSSGIYLKPQRVIHVEVIGQ